MTSSLAQAFWRAVFFLHWLAPQSGCLRLQVYGRCAISPCSSASCCEVVIWALLYLFTGLFYLLGELVFLEISHGTRKGPCFEVCVGLRQRSCPAPFSLMFTCCILSPTFCFQTFLVLLCKSVSYFCLFVYTVFNNSSLECLVHLHFMNYWYLGVSSTFFPLIYCGFSIFPLSFRLIKYFNLFICFSVPVLNLPTGLLRASLVAQCKESSCQCRKQRYDPWVGKIPGEGNDYPLQYSAWRMPVDTGVWWAAVHACVLSRVRLFATLWTVACQAPLSMGLSRQEYWSGLPFPLSRDFPNPGIQPIAPVTCPALAGGSLPLSHLGSAITSWQIDGETMETVTGFLFLGSRITADGDCSHEIKRCLLLGRKAVTNLDSILKGRDITLLTKVCLIKAMVFPVVMYGYESWTIKKSERWRIDAFELWCWRKLLRVPWTTRRSNQSILEEISPEYSLEGLMLKLKLQYFGHLM